MLKINALRIEINTSKGVFGAQHTFSEGLNIIKGHNTAGKSTLLQALMYSLGLEEILGGKNDKVLQSVLKDEIEYNGEKVSVIESKVICEFTNGTEPVTVRRSIKSEIKSTKLIEVYFKDILTQKLNIGDQEPKPMYIHDSGGATNLEFGFHSFSRKIFRMGSPNCERFQQRSNQTLFNNNISCIYHRTEGRVDRFFSPHSILWHKKQ